MLTSQTIGPMRSSTRASAGPSGAVAVSASRRGAAHISSASSQMPVPKWCTSSTISKPKRLPSRCMCR
jgi:hypothetical protein